MDLLKQRKHHWFFSNATIITCIAILSICWACEGNQTSPTDDNLYLSENTIYFGVVPDSINKVTHELFLVNNTQDTCVISNIERSCGCTNIEMSNKIILPHNSAKITVFLTLTNEYNFVERDINIYTNLSNSPLTLYVSAIREVPSILVQKEFPVKFGNELRLSSNVVLLGYAQHGQAKNYSLNIINHSKEKKQLRLMSKPPKEFEVIYPTELSPQEISRIVFVYNPNKNTWGEISHEYTFVDEKGETITLQVYAIVTEKFERGKLTSPRICVPQTAYSYKAFLRKKQLLFDIVNVGKDSLFIRHIQSSNENIRVSSNKNYCMHGDTCKIIVSMVKEEQISNDILIGVVTNDKMEPYKQLRILK